MRDECIDDGIYVCSRRERERIADQVHVLEKGTRNRILRHVRKAGLNFLQSRENRCMRRIIE